jgi:hypothetical protein
MITPTIGRIVWFHPGEKSPYPKQNDQPHAAIIVDVQSPSVVNLTVCAPSGDTYAARGVLLLQDGETPPSGESYAEWMPYQKAQAAKTGQLEQKFAGGEANATKSPAAPAGGAA